MSSCSQAASRYPCAAEPDENIMAREQTEEELKGTTATPEDRQRMLQVLQRMQDSGNESQSASSSDSDDGDIHDAEQLLRGLELQVRGAACEG